MKRTSIIALLLASMAIPLAPSASASNVIGGEFSFQNMTSQAAQLELNIFGTGGVGTDIRIFNDSGSSFSNPALRIAPSTVSIPVPPVGSVTTYKINGTIASSNLNKLQFMPSGSGSGSQVSNAGNLNSTNVFKLAIDSGLTVVSAIYNAVTDVLSVSYNNGGSLTGSFTIDDLELQTPGSVTVVPIPAAGVMLISALMGLLVVGRRGKGNTEEAGADAVV